MELPEITQEVRAKLGENAEEIIDLLCSLTIMRPPAGVICAPTFANGLGMRAAAMLNRLSLPIPERVGFYMGNTNQLEELAALSTSDKSQA